MSIKLALLKSGETLISDIKELISEDGNEKPYGYLFSKPKKVSFSVPILVEESDLENNKNKLEKSVEISFSPWILLSKDDNILVPIDWVVTIVEPIDTLKSTYEGEVNGSNN